MKPRTIKNCVTCNTEFRAYSKHKSRFCSHKCRVRFRQRSYIKYGILKHKGLSNIGIEGTPLKHYVYVSDTGNINEGLDLKI